MCAQPIDLQQQLAITWLHTDERRFWQTRARERVCVRNIWEAKNPRLPLLRWLHNSIIGHCPRRQFAREHCFPRKARHFRRYPYLACAFRVWKYVYSLINHCWRRRWIKWVVLTILIELGYFHWYICVCLFIFICQLDIYAWILLLSPFAFLASVPDGTYIYKSASGIDMVQKLYFIFDTAQLMQNQKKKWLNFSDW
jgi:hypothetical protein